MSAGYDLSDLNIISGLKLTNPKYVPTLDPDDLLELLASMYSFAEPHPPLSITDLCAPINEPTPLTGTPGSMSMSPTPSTATDLPLSPGMAMDATRTPGLTSLLVWRWMYFVHLEPPLSLPVHQRMHVIHLDVCRLLAL